MNNVVPDLFNILLSTTLFNQFKTFQFKDNKLKWVNSNNEIPFYCQKNVID